MKSRPLWQVSVVTSPEAEDAVAALLQDVLDEPISIYEDVETRRTTVTAYLSRPPQHEGVRAALRQGLARIRGCGLKISPARLSVQRLKREDWANSWKRHFRPLSIGAALLVKPGWSRRVPRPGQAVVILDPGLSFGTGQHPTTSFCLQALVAGRGPGRSFLDIGTGSGILAIAAARLGYGPVVAFDFDPEAVRVARANARRNRVSRRLHIEQADLTRLPLRSPEKFHVICANLISPLLISERKRIVNRLAPQGTVVLAGILKKEFAPVRRAYEQAGLVMVSSRSEREWRSGAFARTA